jgi:hypothetical protein
MSKMFIKLIIILIILISLVSSFKLMYPSQYRFIIILVHQVSI